jgi:hypothetical protein
VIRLKPVIVLALAFLLCGLCPLGAYGGCDYYLYQPLQFADGKVQGCVRKHELESAFGRKVEIGTDNKSNDGYEFLWDGGERRKVENCNDYIKAKQRGGTAGTTFEISMESFFIHTCGALAGLKSSSVPKKDFVDVKTYPALEKFPVFLLPYLSGDQEAELLAASNAGKNLKEYAISKEIEINRKEKSFGVIWDDMERSFDLVAEGDFTGDGYASLLVFTVSHSRTGTLRAYEYILLTMRDNNQKMYDVRSEDEGCLYEKGQYVCSPEQRWSALQKEELQPTH